MGPYDRDTDDPFVPGPGFARPCLTFYQHGTQLVDIEARPVVARFRAGGPVGRHPAGCWEALLVISGAGRHEAHFM